MYGDDGRPGTQCAVASTMVFWKTFYVVETVCTQCIRCPVW